MIRWKMLKTLQTTQMKPFIAEVTTLAHTFVANVTTGTFPQETVKRKAPTGVVLDAQEAMASSRMLMQTFMMLINEQRF